MRTKAFLQLKEPTKNFLQAHDGPLELRTCFRYSFVLVLLLDSSCEGSIVRFQKLLISIIKWISKGTRSLYGFAAFLLSEPMGIVFPRHGIHFLPLASRNSNFLVGSSISNWGIFKIYNTGESCVPLSLNFAALPSYFKGLHLAAHLGSPNLLFDLSRKAMFLTKKLFLGFQSQGRHSHVPMVAKLARPMLSVTVSHLSNGNGLDGAAKTAAVVAQNSEVLRGSRIRKQQRRRSSLRLSRGRTASPVSLLPREKFSSIPLVDSLGPKPHELFLGNSFACHNIKDISASPGSYPKPTKIAKRSHGDLTKELKSLLSEIKQNIDVVHCRTNVLVTASDRCWREEGAEVFLELSGTNDWCLAVKVGDSLRYLHRPRDMKYIPNRYTHSYMWIGEEGWSLEFVDRREWLTFKELLAECQRRNIHKEDASLKIIPVPVFHEVPDYENDILSNFERPEQYICMKHGDEIL
ncbi:hypothetical protein HPP92_007036 [Vanilla planifolia]|uniref:Uncharacterized protein n=1 Tax=Vanilla planifolia TaxID=51239 RepID=A0A835RQ32_VANPL|nr:hypothetical protein HPP92_007036 [Vanilla planifolia]